MTKKTTFCISTNYFMLLLGCNRETPKDESQQNYEDESNISKTKWRRTCKYKQ